MIKNCFILLLLFCANCACAQKKDDTCNRRVRYKRLASKLDSSICVPDTHEITDLEDEVDLDGDGLKDKIVQWQKINIADGDTVIHAIYKQSKDGGFVLYKSLTNLLPLYFKNYDVKSADARLESIRSAYVYPVKSIVEFKNKTIELTFYTEDTTIKKLIFVFQNTKETWVLSRQLQWFAPTEWKEDRRLEYNRQAKSAMPIENFNMLTYIGE